MNKAGNYGLMMTQLIVYKHIIIYENVLVYVWIMIWYQYSQAHVGINTLIFVVLILDINTLKDLVARLIIWLIVFSKDIKDPTLISNFEGYM